jgi:hypothetical protein
MEGLMEFQSILFADTPMELDRSMPAFFQDLHLDYILNIIKHHTTGDYQTDHYYYTFPGSRHWKNSGIAWTVLNQFQVA